MSIEQQQGEEERRRAEEDAIAESVRQSRANDYLNAMDEGRYDTSTDMAPDGRNIAAWNRNIIGPQMAANHRNRKERT